MRKNMYFKYVYMEYEGENKKEFPDEQEDIENYLRYRDFCISTENGINFINDIPVNTNTGINTTDIYFHQLLNQYQDVCTAIFIFTIQDLLQNNLNVDIFGGSIYDSFEYDILDLICRIIHGIFSRQNILQNSGETIDI